MKRFRFTLQPIAVLRAHRELRAREAFGDAARGFARAEAELAAVRERVVRFEVALRAGRNQCFSPAEEARTLVAYRQECIVEANAERAVLAAQAVMQQRRVEYLEARRNTEIVSKLELKARMAHRLACNREEQAALDDFAGQRFATRRAAALS